MSPHSTRRRRRRRASHSDVAADPDRRAVRRPRDAEAVRLVRGLRAGRHRPVLRVDRPTAGAAQRDDGRGGGGGGGGGGALLALGLFTPLAGALLTGVMVQAVRSVKMDKGPWSTDGGWELEALFAAGALVFAEIGPGPLALAPPLGIEHSGTGWALLALAAGVAGPTVVVGSGDDGAAPPAEPAAAA